MKLALGTAQFGLDYGISNTFGRINKQEIQKILHIALENDIDLLDTAQSYGQSEEVIGHVGSKGFNIITKISPGININDIINSIQDSLLKLRKDFLEGVLIHDFQDYQKNPEMLDILISLKKKGIIKKVGFSLYHPRELEMLLLKKVDFNILQIPFNIFDQRFKKYFHELKSYNIEIHIRSAFLQGLVFIEPTKLSKHFSSHLKVFQKFHEDVSKSKKNITETCLNFVKSNAEIDRAIIGVNKSTELMSNIQAFQNHSIGKGKTLGNYDLYKIDDEKIILPYKWT